MNIETYQFHTLVEDLFDTSDLTRLHNVSPEKYEKLFEVGMDSSTVYHKKFYDKLRSGWPLMEWLYQHLIKAVVSQNYNESFLYQKFPTFRVHLPGNIAVGKFHKDADFNHPTGEENYVIPLTDSDDTASIWVESEPDKGDFTAMKMRVGQLIKFNGNQLTHGNKVNEEGVTRVSMDFRILPLSKYKENESSESMTLKTKFKEGEYYNLFTR